jgi:hypothetical protein
MRGIHFIGVLALAVMFAGTCPARAADKEAVDAAVERGVKYLQGMQEGNGTWGNDRVGLTALCGLTLLECGVATDDDGIQKAAAAVRTGAVDTEQTYSIALSILFLDRLGEPVDVALIESLTVRLLGGQNARGGWTYSCPRIPAAETRRLSTLVQDRARLGRAKDTPKPEPGKRRAEDLPDEIKAQLKQVQRQHAAGDPTQDHADNSNTQFAVLGLWVARRHGLPVDGALGATEQRFRRAVRPDGGWGYIFPPPPRPGVVLPPAAMMQTPVASSPAMTCAGLLGVGLAYGAWNESALRTGDKDKEPGRPGARPVKPQDPSKDPVVVNAFHLLGHWVDEMAAAQAGGKPPRVNAANGKFYYFLWSLERVSVAYGVDKIGKTDWYDWGADILLANQDAGGGWTNGEFRGAPDTCFALLVLRRANLAQDLTRALKSQMKDGDLRAALRQGGTSGAELVKGRKPFFGVAVVEDPKHKPDGQEDTQAGRLAKQLIAADGDKRAQILKELCDGKGSAYTQALAGAIPRLDGNALKQAREALAERMSRMNSATLGAKLEDDDPEVRRAAALAVAMKDDKSHVYRLIELLSDPEARVARAAYASLKAISKEDFGPARDATQPERAKAILAWKGWWARQQQGDK